MKVRLVQIDNEERKRGRGFMKRMKERWTGEYPEHAINSQHTEVHKRMQQDSEQTMTKK